MKPPHYALEVPTDFRRRLAAGWLALALGALLVSGFFAVLLVLARAPGSRALFPGADFFQVALVVHVNLSVLVWFTGCAGLFWSLAGSARGEAAGWLALVLAATGSLILAAAPFIGRGAPVMANYVPVVDEPMFLSGLLVFAAGAALLVLRAMVAVSPVGVRMDGAGALRFGLNAAAVSAAVALIAFAWSWSEVPRALDPRAYYEILFWGGGHVLQFTWTLLLFVAWLWGAEVCGARIPLSPRVATLLFGIALAAVFVTPVIYLAWDVTSIEHRRWHTWLMRFGGGLAILPFAAALAWALARAGAPTPQARPVRAALVASLVLFGAGGAIGVGIGASNVTVPAHYHGSIVGVTLAFMALVYCLLPALGYAAPVSRAAAWQPWLYGGGQLAHVLGLFWSGGYGIPRKVAGAAQVLRTPEETLAMALMGAGGLVAVAGGMLFLVIVLRAVARAPTQPPMREARA